MEHPHKKFEDYQIKELICRHLTKEIERNYIQKILDKNLEKESKNANILNLAG